MLERAPSVERGSARLAERRRSRRRRGIIAFVILLLLLLSAGMWGLSQSAVRISRVDVSGSDVSLAAYAKSEMQGSYLGIIPRDSIFFFPESSIRSDILAARSDIAAVSIFRNGLTSISIKPNERVPIARWCGSSPETRFDLNATSSRSNLVSGCYLFDASGIIFASAASSTQTLNTFTLYAPIMGETSAPLRMSITNADELPSMFDFARQLDTLGSPVTQVVLRDDEVDDYLVSGTRITYVLGNEKNAFTALVSARDSLNLADGSIDYVDLRFGSKVYLKKK